MYALSTNESSSFIFNLYAQEKNMKDQNANQRVDTLHAVLKKNYQENYTTKRVKESALRATLRALNVLPDIESSACMSSDGYIIASALGGGGTQIVLRRCQRHCWH